MYTMYSTKFKIFTHRNLIIVGVNANFYFQQADFVEIACHNADLFQVCVKVLPEPISRTQQKTDYCYPNSEGSYHQNQMVENESIICFLYLTDKWFSTITHCFSDYWLIFPFWNPNREDTSVPFHLEPILYRNIFSLINLIEIKLFCFIFLHKTR